MKTFKQFLSEEEKRATFRSDNPGGEWLQREKTYAENKYSNHNKGILGSTTGYYSKSLKLKTDMIKHAKGLRDEHQYRNHSPKLENLEKTIGDPKNFDTKKYPILIHVNHRGEGYVGEGNHRLAYAVKHKIPTIHADVRYWNGGEAHKGQWHPSEVEKMRDD